MESLPINLETSRGYFDWTILKSKLNPIQVVKASSLGQMNQPRYLRGRGTVTPTEK
ncbi:unnamed protein product [Paramecium octaurelia]|uniref:Uncharacterized protein n=1 Tax=Paramecium octaurelia TaxID=43137 RepID=A0A8S1YMB2_PAROT|nr:unnamed protein product [Paramecium octaurelia]